MQNTGLDEAQAGIKIARRNINNLRYAGFRPYIGKIPSKGDRLPTPVLLPGKFQRQVNLATPWDLKESDTTEQLSLRYADNTTLIHWQKVKRN